MIHLRKSKYAFLMVEKGEIYIYYNSPESLSHELAHIRLGHKDVLYKGIYDYFYTDEPTRMLFYEIFLLVTDYYVYKVENMLNEYPKMIKEQELKSQFGQHIKKCVKENLDIPLKKWNSRQLRQALVYACSYDNIKVEFNNNHLSIRRNNE